jgi:lysophospholipase L1-like esterase
MAQEQPPAPGGVVFIGSSSIVGWKTLKDDFAPMNVTGRGFGGSQVIDSVVYADRIVIPYRPRSVVLYAGDNDVAAGKTPEQVFSDFKKFVKKIHAALPEVRVYFICIKPSISRWHLWDKMKAANSLVAEFAKKNDLVEYLDIATPMIGQDGKPRPELFVEDGLHLNAAGYKVWTEVVRPRLELKPE